jgi:tripartite-type tricarboxylate transporter receptor subunit TctC
MSSRMGDHMRRRAIFALLASGTLMAAASVAPHPAAAAEAWPSRPITIIVPFGAGSGTDIVTRIIGQPLGIALGQNIVVDDRQGANGGIAATYVAKAPADGYTLLMSTNSPHSANPFLLKNIAYDPVKDFAPVTRIGSFTLMFVINPTLPVKTIPELIAYAKANPGKLTYGSGNTSGILAGETLKHWAGIDILQVPYKSVPPALNDVIAGRVSMTFTDLTPGLPHVNSGSLRALGITRLKRSVLLPDLPTFDESGLKDFEVESWAGLFAPAGIPADIVTRLNLEIRKIVENPQVKAQIAQIGFEVFGSTPEELGAFVKDQLVRTARMVKDAGIEPE